MNNYSTEIAQAIQNTIEDMDLHMVAFDEERGVFSFTMNIPGPISTIRYIIKTHKDDYTVIAICPVRPAGNLSEVLPSVAEFVCRANYGLKNGNFELDFNDGELRFKCFVDCDDQIPSHRVIRSSICTPSAMMMRYGHGLINVLYKGADPETAVDECEGAQGLLRGLEETGHAIDRLLKRRHNNNNQHSLDLSDLGLDGLGDLDLSDLDLDGLRLGGRGLGDLSLADDDMVDIPSFEEYQRSQTTQYEETSADAAKNEEDDDPIE